MTAFSADSALTQSNARAALKTGLAHIATGANQVDCAPLNRFDSSALAVLLAWHRAARGRGIALRVLNLPPQLANLARAYGIDALILHADNTAL